jgi:hypothetical protein
MSISTSVWDNADLKSGGEFVKFEAIGDTISGTVTAVRVHRWDDGSVCPQLFLEADDGQERTITAGQVRLKAALAEKRPEAGDRITITLTEIEKRAGGKTLKHFDVQVQPGGGTSAPATTAPVAPPAAPVAAAAPTPDLEAATAALANLTPEQRAALGMLPA